MPPQRNQPPQQSSNGPAAGADRFWDEFARSGRRDRGPEEGPEPERPNGNGGGTHHGECLEWCPICRSAELLRNAVTPELRARAEALQQEAVEVFQALLAVYAERTASAPSGRRDDRARPDNDGADDQPTVTDIPLD